MSQLPPKAVPLSEAVAAITNYRRRIQNDAPHHLHAFLIKHDDICGVLGIDPHLLPQMSYGRFRGYLGIKEEDSIIHWHFYVVPVDDTPDTNDIILKTADGEPYVYDFNTPCPTTCDANYSPLNDIHLD